MIENKHFDTKKPTRVRCDASRNGLGASLEQYLNNNWHPVAYASRFLNCNEQKYSTNELELLAVVWSLEHFKYFTIWLEIRTPNRPSSTFFSPKKQQGK